MEEESDEEEEDEEEEEDMRQTKVTEDMEVDVRYSVYPF